MMALDLRSSLLLLKVGDVAQFPLPNADGSVKLVKGDHSPDLERVCAEISEASNYAANDS